MRLALVPAPLEREEVRFEVDRFQPADDGRLELSGRWVGVRGRRFVRPTLTIITELSRTRMLADLEHKPWAADDGQSWHASFPWDPDGTDVVDVELAVATDIVISLPPPGADAGAWPRAVDEAPEAAADLKERAVKPRAETTSKAQAPEPEVELRELTHALKTEHRKARRLLAELERTRSEALDATSEHQQAQATIGELREALAEAMRVAEQAVAERDEAVQACELARTGHDQETRIRDQALEERDHAVAERDQAAEERDQARAERDQAAEERDQALASRNKALAERKRALGDRDKARRSREQAISQGRTLLAARRDANEELRAELARALSERDMVLRQLDVMRAESDARVSRLHAQLEEAQQRTVPIWPAPAVASEPPAVASEPPRSLQPPAVAPPPVITRSVHSARRTRVDWMRRAIALTVLLAVVIALLVVLRFV